MATSTVSSPTPANAIPDIYAKWNDLLQNLQKKANQGRVPMGAELEEESSRQISALLNPPDLFPDTSRAAAEWGASRGVSGSPAAASAGVRMTDDEKLRRIELGQKMFSDATTRNPSADLPDISQFMLSPYQAEILRLQQEKQALDKKLAELQFTQNKRGSSFNPGMPNLAGAGGDWTNTGGNMPIGGFPWTGDSFGTRDAGVQFNPNAFADSLTGILNNPGGAPSASPDYWTWSLPSTGATVGI